MSTLIVFIVIALVIGFPIYFFFFTKEAIVINKLKNIKSKKISKVVDGEVVKIKGKIKYIGNPLIAPLSKRKCVYYHIIVEESDRRSKNVIEINLTKDIEEKVSRNVIIIDGKDYAIIDTKLMESYLTMDKEYWSGFLLDAKDNLEKFLERHNEESTVFGFNRELNYKEGILEEGETIAVVGKATWKNAKDLNIKIPNEKILVISADNNEPVYFSDDPDITSL